VPPDLTNHLPGVSIREGHDAKADVTEDLDVDPPEAERHDGPEGGVVGHPEHHLGASLEHGLDQNALHRLFPALLLEARTDLFVRRAHLSFVVETELDASDLRLVGDLHRGELHGHGKTQPPGDLGGLGGRGSHPAGCDVEPGPLQHSTRLGHREPSLPPPLHRPPAHGAGAREVLVPELGERPGRRRLPDGVATGSGGDPTDLLGKWEGGDRRGLRRSGKSVPDLLPSHDRDVDGFLQDSSSPPSVDARGDRLFDRLGPEDLHGRVDDDEPVHFAGTEEGLDRPPVGVRPRRGDHVHRIGGGGDGGEEGREFLLELPREARHLEPRRLEGVRTENRRPSRVRHDREAGSLGQGLRGEGPRDPEHLLEGVGPKDPRLAEERLHRHVAPGESPRVGARRTPSGLAPTRLDHHDRLRPAHPPGDPAEATRPGERLEVEEEDPGLRVLLPVLEEVVPGHVGLVPHADEGREAEAEAAGEGDDRDPEGAALGAEGNPAMGWHSGCERGVEPHGGVRVEEAEAVGPHHPHPVPPGRFQERPLSPPPLRSHLSEAGADDDQPPHARPCALLHHLGHDPGGNSDHRQIDGVSDRGDRRPRPDRRHLLRIRIHRVDGPGELRPQQALQDPPTDARTVPGRAHHRNRARRKKGPERRFGERTGSDLPGAPPLGVELGEIHRECGLLRPLLPNGKAALSEEVGEVRVAGGGEAPEARVPVAHGQASETVQEKAADPPTSPRRGDGEGHGDLPAFEGTIPAESRQSISPGFLHEETAPTPSRTEALDERKERVRLEPQGPGHVAPLLRLQGPEERLEPTGVFGQSPPEGRPCPVPEDQRPRFLSRGGRLVRRSRSDPGVLRHRISRSWGALRELAPKPSRSPMGRPGSVHPGSVSSKGSSSCSDRP